MSRLLLNLRHVPDDEIEEVREMLDQDAIAYYQTQPSRWGMSYGGIWVSNVNGSIQNGDLVTTSPIPGIGMRQHDDLLRNFTVAKVVMDCDFDLNAKAYTCKEVEHEGKTYRMAFLACVYQL